MAVEWLSASGDPAAERLTCMRYCFSVRQAATNVNADSILLLYQVRP